MNYLERLAMYEKATKKCFEDIMEVALSSPYPTETNGKQYVDFLIGSIGSKVRKVRVLIDFRGEYFSSFFLDTSLPVSVTGPIRNSIHFTAIEAYEYAISRAEELNKTD